jgi:pimeloyl-ACP methyl ester carboxylesterase
MPYADINGLKLFYTEEGSGPPLLCIHGWTCDGNDWAWQIPALTGTYRVIAMDIRGHGRSDVPEDGYTLGQFADDAAELLRVLNATPAVVMGHSLGFAIAATLAQRNPEMVRALIDVDGATGMLSGDREQFAGLVAALEGGAHAVAQATLFQSPAFYSASSPKHLMAWHARRMLGTPEPVVARTMAGLATGPGALIFQEDAAPALSALAVPVLAHRISPAVAGWERTVLGHPLSKVVSYEGSGHWIHQERPAEFNAITAAWLAALPKG